MIFIYILIIDSSQNAIYIIYFAVPVSNNTSFEQ